MRAAEARAYFEGLSRLGMRFGLERMRASLESLGHPERRYRVLHVAGTNGKGSTCAMAASILQEAGLRVGLYTSPHLVRVNERIRVDGEEIADEELAEGIARLAKILAARDACEPLTFFEFGTLLALNHFAERKVEVAVLEVGLGGRLDATNAVAAELCAVARIGLDHTELLGSTLAQIAAEKAGIFKPGARVLIGRQRLEALSVLESRARELAASPRVAGREFELEGEGAVRFSWGARRWGPLELPLAGPHQRENAELAIACALDLVPRLGDGEVRLGLARARWPGRFETVRDRPRVVLDGAHNPDGARALAGALEALHSQDPIHLVLGVLADKDVRGVAQALMPFARTLSLVAPKSERALEPERLGDICRELGADPVCYPTVAAALSAAQAAALAEGTGGLVLVAGSLYLVGEARALLCGNGGAVRQ